MGEGRSRWFPCGEEMVWEKSLKVEDEAWGEGFQMGEGCDLLSKWGGVWIRQVSTNDGWLEEFKYLRKYVGLMSK